MTPFVSSKDPSNGRPNRQIHTVISDKASTATSSISFATDRSPPLLPIKESLEPSWKPFTLRSIMLFSMIGFAAVLIAALEYLSRLSNREGGIAFSTGGFSASITFVNLYLPTIIAVALGMFWTWIDLDARRLEPFFQLSDPQGALAKDSLDLNYHFDYVALASFKALRKGHWSVVFASMAVMTIFWAVTPLLSATFSIKTISRSLNVNATTLYQLIPEPEQVQMLTVDFMMTAYGALWVGQSLPAFVTNETASIPFVIDSKPADQLKDETWTASSMTYGTNLTCTPAKVHGNGAEASYSNGKGCVTTPGALTFDYSQNFTALYIGFYEGTSTDFSLNGIGCPDPKFSHRFLAFWGAINNGKPQITALFCEPSYWKQQANVTVLQSNQSVVDIVPLEGSQLLTEAEFNITNFEFVLGNGSPAQPRRADRPDMETVLDQMYRLENMGINPNATITNMVGYALGATQYPLTRYLEEDVLASAFEKAHKLLFALAANSLISSSPMNPEPRQGRIFGPVGAMVVSRKFSIAAEAALGFVIVMAAGLMLINWNRNIKLETDPASLNSIMAMMNPREFSRDGRVYLERGKLNHHRHDQFREKQSQIEEKPEVAILPGSDYGVRPIELKFATGVVFLLVLIFALATMIGLKTIIDQQQGLQIPSENEVVYQILTNYLPVIFATLLEPFWTLLNRFLCLLKPFDALRRGDATPSRSLYLKYTSLPPPMVIWRAFRAKHFVLVATCAIGLSTNILTVAMSGLFSVKTIAIQSPQTIRYQYSPIFNSSSVGGPISPEPFYVAKSNITDGVILPPWTTRDTFFIPFHLETTNSNITIKAHTQGFGASMVCREVPQDTKSFITSYNSTTNPTWNFNVDNGKKCSDGGLQPSGGQNNSNVALEIFSALSPVENNSSKDDAFCDTSFIVGFLRANLTVDQDSSFNMYASSDKAFSEILTINSLAASWMVCQANFLTASYDVTVDSVGHILAATRKENYAVDTSPFFTSPLNDTIFMEKARNIWSMDPDWWRNDTFPDSWFGYFVKKLSNVTRLVDPTLPVPALDAVMPTVQDVYSRIFAIMLSLNTAWLTPARGESVQGIVSTSENRLFMSTPAYVISVSLLVLNIVFAIFYYANRPAKMLRRMPTTISSVMDLFAGSGLLTDYPQETRLNDDVKLGYGKFLGTDGKPHLGIERRPFVIPWENERKARP